MSPDRLSACLRIVRWQPDTLAKAVDVASHVAHEWVTGKTAVPQRVAAWLEALTFMHEAAEDAKPFTKGDGFESGTTGEYVPAYAYPLLRSLEHGPVTMKSVYGTDDEAAVYFLVSRGLAMRVNDDLVSTKLGRTIGEIHHD